MGKLSTQRYATGCILVLSSIVTAWFLWITSISPRMGRFPLPYLMVQSLLQLLLDWVCGAAIAVCVYLTICGPAQGVFDTRGELPSAVWFPR
jgi:hypothetical protein